MTKRHERFEIDAHTNRVRLAAGGMMDCSDRLRGFRKTGYRRGPESPVVRNESAHEMEHARQRLQP
jgi:hypothetical protein